MSNNQDENNHNSTDQISHLGSGENGGYQENIVSSTSSYASVPENRNKSTKRKNTNESDRFYKKTCLEGIGSGTTGKQMGNEDNKMAAPVEHQSLAQMVRNSFENYPLEQERLHKDVIPEAENQHNSEESHFPASIYLNPFQDNRITNFGENFDLSISKAADTNLLENTLVNNDFCSHLDNEKEWHRKESASSENFMKNCQEPFFTAYENENPPSDRKLYSTSIFSELPNEMIANNLNETNNAITSKTEDFEEQRAFLGEVLRDADSRKSDNEFLILPSTSAYHSIENNESFTIPVEDMILINDAKKFTGAEAEHRNKVTNTWSIILGTAGEMRLNNTEEQTSLPMDGVSYSNTINGKTFILNDKDKVQDRVENVHPEMKEESSIDTETMNFRLSDVEGPNSYHEVISLDETTCNGALKLNKETYSPYRQSFFSEQDNFSPKQEINRIEVEKNTYLESIILTGSGTLCGQVEEPIILDESTDPYLCKQDKEYTSCQQNPDYLDNNTRSRECIILNSLEDNHDENNTKNSMEYEIERLENDNFKILKAETLQLVEFQTGFESSGDIVMPNNVNSKNNIVPTAIRQEAIAQTPNAFNVNPFGSSHISIKNSRLDRKEIQGSSFTDVIRIEPTITNTKCSSINISNVLPESCLDQLMARPQVLQNFQSSIGVTRKSTKESEKVIINKLILEYMRNKTHQEFTVQDIAKFVTEQNTSLPFIAVLHSIRISLEEFTKSGIFKLKANGKYKIECDGTPKSFAQRSKKERGIEKCSIRNGQSKQNIEVEDNLQNAGHSMKASESHSADPNDSIQ